MNNLIEFIVIAMGAWRLSEMLSDVSEDGPAHLLQKLRSRVGVAYDEYSAPYGKTWVAEGLLCIKCVSVWVGILFGGAYLLSPIVGISMALPFALSGIAILINRRF